MKIFQVHFNCVLFCICSLTYRLSYLSLVRVPFVRVLFVRQMKYELRKKMKREIEELQDLILRDDDDEHFREIEADRIRRQLQLATYHARFKPRG